MDNDYLISLYKGIDEDVKEYNDFIKEKEEQIKEKTVKILCEKLRFRTGTDIDRLDELEITSCFRKELDTSSAFSWITCYKYAIENRYKEVIDIIQSRLKLYRIGLKLVILETFKDEDISSITIQEVRSRIEHKVDKIYKLGANGNLEFFGMTFYTMEKYINTMITGDELDRLILSKDCRMSDYLLDNYNLSLDDFKLAIKSRDFCFWYNLCMIERVRHINQYREEIAYLEKGETL